MEEFTPPTDDPLALEHATVNRWVQDAIQTGGPNPWAAVKMSSLESGRFLLKTHAEQARRLLLAAVLQARHWDERMAQLRARAQSETRQINVYHDADWRQIETPRRHTVAAIRSLLRRSLPLERPEIVSLVTWALGSSSQELSSYLTQALQRYAAAQELDPELNQLFRKFAMCLRSSHNKKAKSLGTLVEQLYKQADVAPSQGPVTVKDPPKPSSVGCPLVFHDLKCLLGIVNTDDDPPRLLVGPDRFLMPAASPLAAEHEKLTQLLNETISRQDYYALTQGRVSVGQDILELDPALRGRMLLAAAERQMAALFVPTLDLNDTACLQSRCAIVGIAGTMAQLPVQLDRDLLFDFLLYLLARPQDFGVGVGVDQSYDAFLVDVEAATEDGATLTAGERFVLHLWRGARIQSPPLGVSSPDIEKVTRWIGDDARFYLVPGERWSDAVNADLALLPCLARSPWIALWRHLLTATSSRPSERWRKAAIQQVNAIGERELHRSLERWLPLVLEGRTLARAPGFLGDMRGGGDSIHDENATALRGLLWLVPLLSDGKSLLRLVASVALSAYKKIPGVGPRAVKVGNAAVYALSEVVSPESFGQLAMLKVRVWSQSAQQEIEKAFNAAAKTLQLPRDQIEEVSVPTCGLENVGWRDEAVGKYRAAVAVMGSDAELRWFDVAGKRLKSAPASVKRDHADALKELQQAQKDLPPMLAAQRDRLDSLFLARKTWPFALWRERYLDHPLVGTMARRLIWCVGSVPVTVQDGEALDVEGQPFEAPDAAVITLWHPAGRSVAEVVAWRRRIEALGIVQPFKQAHREVYLLTDAERRTSVYSNRFAAHVLRQHQFNALCGVRRWKNKLRLMVDDCYAPPSRELPEWGLRAEFWVEGIGTEYGEDTNEAGVFLRLASDQVRFYRLPAATNSAHASGGGYLSVATGPGTSNVNEPISLEDVPTLVFSEIMRDVDLFVGVASIGNDPSWQDGGPGGRYREYWNSYSFGELSGTAVSRREALQQLVPRLKISHRCTLADRFLIVRGDKRTYKIHLGSGNVLMDPNDQYLCIVPDSRAGSNHAPVYLPFEGDRTLSIILSKAFLLAEDRNIRDPLISRQIDGR